MTAFIYKETKSQRGDREYSALKRHINILQWNISVPFILLNILLFGPVTQPRVFIKYKKKYILFLKEFQF